MNIVILPTESEHPKVLPLSAVQAVHICKNHNLCGVCRLRQDWGINSPEEAYNRLVSMQDAIIRLQNRDFRR